MCLLIDKHKVTVPEQRLCIIAGINKVDQSLNAALVIILMPGIHIQGILHTGQRHIDKRSAVRIAPKRVRRLIALVILRTIHIVIGEGQILRGKSRRRTHHISGAALTHIPAGFILRISRI